MSSQAQIAANQANAQLSTGPTTEAGKHTVSQNGIKHCLTGKTHAALAGEEEALEKFVEGYRKSYYPSGLAEEQLVRNIAENYWRLKRAHAMENALYQRILSEESQQTEAAGQQPAPASIIQADAFIDPAKGLQRLALYANRIQRAIEKSTAELKAMQAERKQAFAAAKEEAILLTKLAHVKGETLDATKDFPPPEQAGGFAFSLEAIQREIIRAARLEEARARFQTAA